MRFCSSGDLCIVDTAEDLEKTSRLLEDVAIAGVDLEADSMFHFRERVCIIQICAGTSCFLVDALAIPDMSSLKPFFSDPSIRKVFHGADYDVRSLHRDFGIEINNLFDCELACRFLGEKGTGLNAVVSRRFGVTLDKRYQKKDWSVRPLPPEMVEYAARDVRYLVALSNVLEKELAAKGRKGWVEEECAALSCVRCREDDDSPLFVRFKGAGRLGRRALAALEELLRARLELARAMDRPPFKVVSNDRLLRIATARPLSRARLKEMGVLSPRQLAMYGDAFLEAVRRAESLDEKGLPVYPRSGKNSTPPGVSTRIDALKKWRARKAEELGLDAGLLFPKDLMVSVATGNPRTVNELASIEGVRQWRVREFGREILELLKNTG